MPKKYDVVAITGTYKKEGEDKPRYQTVGMVIEKEGKMFLKMNNLVTVHDNGLPIAFFSLFAPKVDNSRPVNQQGSGNAPQKQLADDFDDEIPF